MQRLYHRYQIVAYAAALVSMLTFAVASRDPLIAILAFPATVTSALLFRSNTISPVPRWLINILLSLATLSLLRVFYGPPEEVVTILGQFLVWLLVIKLFESHTPRNQGPSIVLSLLLIVASVLTEVTLDVGLMLLLYAPLALSWAVLYQLYLAASHAHAAREGHNWASSDPHRPPFRLRLSSRAYQQSRRLVLAGAALAIACAAIIFVLMPRNVGEGALAEWPTPANTSRTGLSNDFIQLGQDTNIQESDEQVMTVAIQRFQTIGSGPSETLIPQFQRTGPHLLRSIVLDTYRPKQGTWQRSTPMANQSQIVTRTTPVADDTALDGIARPRDLKGAPVAGFLLDIKPLRPAREEIVTLWMPLAIRATSSRGRTFEQNPFDALTRITDAERRGLLRGYSVLAASAPELGLFTTDGKPTPALEAWYRNENLHQNPFLNAEPLAPVRQLADQILQQQGITPEPDNTWFERLGLPDLADNRTPPPRDTRAIARAFETHLERNYLYTLDLQPIDRTQDPIVDFLFNSKQGHCEYFASALAALLRATNINARVVLGYVATEFDPVEEAFVIRERHAHAWVEAELSPGVWTSLDPSPDAETQRVHRPDDSLLASLARWFDRAEGLWIRSVISFDQESQAELFGMQADGSFARPDWLRSLFSPNPTEGNSRFGAMLRASVATLITFALLFTALAAAYFAILRIINNRRQRRQRTSSAQHQGPEANAYLQALEALQNAGKPKPPSVPPHTFAESLAPQHPRAAHALRNITRLYYAARFGNRRWSEQNARDAANTLEQLKAALTGHATPSQNNAKPTPRTTTP